MLSPRDKALLEMTSEIGIMLVTQENEAQIERLAERGLLERASPKGYRLTRHGSSSDFKLDPLKSARATE